MVEHLLSLSLAELLDRGTDGGVFGARMAAASRAAFTAPARPMASVPTGIPAGICTIDRSESTPRSTADSIGTPNTGNEVFAAAIPGRSSCPPSPGNDHFDPTICRIRRVIEQQVRRPVGGDHPDFVRNIQ